MQGSCVRRYGGMLPAAGYRLNSSQQSRDRLPNSIQHDAMTNRDPCAESTETSPPQVLSLPRTGGREAMYLPHGFVQSADTRAGDASSPAHSSFSGRLSSLEGAAIVNLAHNGARPASRDSQAGAALPCLQISPGDVARRQSASWGPLGGEIVQVTQQALFEPRFCAPSRLLIAAELGERHEGESFVEGLPARRCATLSEGQAETGAV
jgi:hypothetical protein